jgi:HAMP domain-containing protein
MKPMQWRRSGAAFVAAGLATGLCALAVADPQRTTDDTATRYERFVLGGCSPCVKELYAIATLPIAPPPVPAVPRAAAPTARPGEILVEVLRAYPLGRPGRHALALRLTLSVATMPPGEPYRLGTGVLDEDEIGALTTAIREMADAVKTSSQPGGRTLDVDFHGGSLRVGVTRIEAETLAFVQAGDIPTFTLRPVWQIPTTLYLSVADLASLAKAVGQASAKVQALRGRP